ncbi:sodium/hydrogen exchanger 3 protein [Toxoplasma gondii GT1]|uniref:Sodium/hydrogen exchanger 3 protein n=6 Tax=Toxoplasma gondii TaxID=5811 RepID=S7UXD6_TOXGG|nr:sodium/hydrogen exchanger 3 protein [Toxoplasma gondii GT1]KAF4640944.1 sodium/hydrogen exchanger 3 protein [Toxoplasma gondii]
MAPFFPLLSSGPREDSVLFKHLRPSLSSCVLLVSLYAFVAHLLPSFPAAPLASPLLPAVLSASASGNVAGQWTGLFNVPSLFSNGNSTLHFSRDASGVTDRSDPPPASAVQQPSLPPPGVAPPAGAPRVSADISATTEASAGSNEADALPASPSSPSSPASAAPSLSTQDEADEKKEDKATPSRLATAAPPTAAEGLAASFTNVNMLLLALCLLCCFTLGYFIHMNVIPHLPDSAAAMLTGVLFGLLARLFGPSPSENSFLHFDPQFFYFVLLPPIVLEAGFCLNKAAFLYNLGAILLLSILGTLLSTVVVAQITFSTAHISGLEGPAHEIRGFSWAFASLISATDTVATLSIIGSPKFRLGKKGVDLYSILMGESVLNDAVSIALTRSVLKLFFTSDAAVAQRVSGIDVIADFVAVVVGSLVVGLGMGGLCCFCFRHSQLKKLPEYEVAITLLTAYMAFGVSEWLGFSGVVALFFCGVMLGHFNVHNLSKKSRYSIDTVFKTIALISEKIVFAYLGVVAAVGVGERTFNIFFVLISLGACAVSRVACVFPLCFVSNKFRQEEERIDCGQQVLMWLAGLRGAVAFALAMTIPCSHDMWRAVCRHNKDLVVTTTLVLVAITTLGVGSILEYSALKLGAVLPRRDNAEGSAALLLHSPSGDGRLRARSSEEGPEERRLRTRETSETSATPPCRASTSGAADVVSELASAPAAAGREDEGTEHEGRQPRGEGRLDTQTEEHDSYALQWHAHQWERERDFRSQVERRPRVPDNGLSREEFDERGRPVSACVRFLYRLDREYLQRWLGSGEESDVSEEFDFAESRARRHACTPFVASGHHRDAELAESSFFSKGSQAP